MPVQPLRQESWPREDLGRRQRRQRRPRVGARGDHHVPCGRGEAELFVPRLARRHSSPLRGSGQAAVLRRAGRCPAQAVSAAARLPCPPTVSTSCLLHPSPDRSWWFRGAEHGKAGWGSSKQQCWCPVLRQLSEVSVPTRPRARPQLLCPRARAQKASTQPSRQTRSLPSSTCWETRAPDNTSWCCLTSRPRTARGKSASEFARKSHVHTWCSYRPIGC